MQGELPTDGLAPGLRPALLTPCFWPEVRRGTERLLGELARGLVTSGHRPRVITSHPGLFSRDVENGYEVVRHWRPPDGWLRRRQFEDYLTHVPFTYLSLIRGDDSLAHAFFESDALAAVRWSRRTGRPSVLTYNGIPDPAGLLNRRRRLDITMRVVRDCSAVVAVSHAAREAFRRWLGIEAELIRPGVDLDVFSPGGERDDVPTILYAGSVEEPRKRIGLLLAALRLVRRERPSARLLLIRPPDDLAAPLIAEPGVELIDPAEDPAQLVPIYRRAWVSVLPAVGETFGLVLAEALACGTPAVGSELGGIPEIIDRPEIGRVFTEQHGERGLARALLDAFDLAADPATPAACAERAGEFSTGRSVAAYERLYRELLR